MNSYKTSLCTQPRSTEGRPKRKEQKNPSGFSCFFLFARFARRLRPPPFVSQKGEAMQNPLPCGRGQGVGVYKWHERKRIPYKRSDVVAIIPYRSQVSSLPSTTPLEGSGRAVHDRERPGVGWNPLSLTEGEGDWGCGRKWTENPSKVTPLASTTKCTHLATHDVAENFPRRQVALKALAMQNPLPCGRG